MKIGIPLIPSSFRLGITSIIVLMVISSPVVMLVNPTLKAAPSTTDVYTSLAPSTIGQDGGTDFTAQAALSGVSARQTNNIVGVQSYYDVVFTTTTTGTIKFIDITFPAGILIGAAPNLAEREGIGAGTAAKTSTTTIRYTVTSAVSVPAGTQIRLEFFNIVNPTLPSTGYKVTVSTRTAGGTVIDGPTASNGFSMKQIGTGQIADNSITSTKPAESFMKRVTVKDTPLGHSIGWDPNGATRFFNIGEPAITVPNTHFVGVSLSSGLAGQACVVTAYDTFGHRFGLDCTVAPAEGTSLEYVVITLPSIVVG